MTDPDAEHHEAKPFGSTFIARRSQMFVKDSGQSNPYSMLLPPRCRSLALRQEVGGPA